MNSEVERKIRKFVLEKCYDKTDVINNETYIFREGYLDSMGFISLVAYIEEEYNILPSDDEIIEENFESIDAICKYITKHF